MTLPQYENMVWYRVIDTSLSEGEDFLIPGQEMKITPQNNYQINTRSVVVLLGK